MSERTSSKLADDETLAELQKYAKVPKITVDDARASVKVPYSSIADSILRQKKEVDQFIHSTASQDAEQKRRIVKQQLHELEIKKIQLQRTLDDHGLSRSEVDGRVGELDNYQYELENKLSLLEKEQNNFRDHLKDINGKHEELAKQLRDVEDKEGFAQREAKRLADEKVALAKKLAEVVHQHAESQNTVAQLAARRLALEEALNKMQVDSQMFVSQIDDLERSRDKLIGMQGESTSDQKTEANKIRDIEDRRRHVQAELDLVSGDIQSLQGELARLTIGPLEPMDLLPIRTEPLNPVPDVVKTVLPQIHLSKTEALPAGYRPTNAVKINNLPVAANSRAPPATLVPAMKSANYPAAHHSPIKYEYNLASKAPINRHSPGSASTSILNSGLAGQTMSTSRGTTKFNAQPIVALAGRSPTPKRSSSVSPTRGLNASFPGALTSRVGMPGATTSRASPPPFPTNRYSPSPSGPADAPPGTVYLREPAPGQAMPATFRKPTNGGGMTFRNMSSSSPPPPPSAGFGSTQPLEPIPAGSSL